MVTADQLARISHDRKPEKFAHFVEPLALCFDRYAINTPLRVAHFIAQVMHESGGFRYQEEIADGSQYEGRLDLGNDRKGDGKRYKGRGLIQITGRYSYGKYGMYRKVDFLALPDLVAHIPYCVDSAGWFWSVEKNLNHAADEDNIYKISRRINGGNNGAMERRDYLHRAKVVLDIF